MNAWAAMAGSEPIEAGQFRQAMRCLASGVAIVATGSGEDRRGLTVSAVTSVCTEPPCLLVGINTSSESHDRMLTNKAFGVSLLGNGHEELAMIFAGQRGIDGAARFASAEWSTLITGAPLLPTAICTIDCVLHSHQIVGSHGLFIGRIVGSKQPQANKPVVNFQGKLHTLS